MENPACEQLVDFEGYVQGSGNNDAAAKCTGMAKEHGYEANRDCTSHEHMFCDSTEKLQLNYDIFITI